MGKFVLGTPRARIGVGRGGEDSSSPLLSLAFLAVEELSVGCVRARFQCHTELGDSDVLVAWGETSGFRVAAVALHLDYQI